MSLLTVAHGCTLTTAACGADFNCLPKLPGMDFECVCKKNDDDQCITDGKPFISLTNVSPMVSLLFIFLVFLVKFVRTSRFRLLLEKF